MTSFIQSIPISENTSLKVSVGISVSFLFVLVAILLKQCIKKIRELPKRREKYEIAKLLEKKLNKHSRSFGLTTRKFTALELRLATGGFCDSQVIAEEGTRAKVYKGILTDKSMAVIKKFESDASTRKQFFNEASIFSLVNHRHVVRLLGYCTDWTEEALVYEFINNGTLYDHIHGKGSPLSLELRMKIALEIAAALGYLHSSTSKPSILHRNVNSKSILLEENYTARLASFKGAKLAPEGQSSRIKSIVQKSSKFVKSEAIQSNLFIDKKVDDVYGFGVVLVELLTSQEAVSDRRPGEEKDLAPWLDKNFDRQIINMGNMDTAKKVADLAKKCLSSKKDERPSMKDVAIELGIANYGKAFGAEMANLSPSPEMANLSPSPAMANFFPSPKETDHLLGSAAKAQGSDDVVFKDLGSSGIITSAGFHDSSMQNQMQIKVEA